MQTLAFAPLFTRRYVSRLIFNALWLSIVLVFVPFAKAAGGDPLPDFQPVPAISGKVNAVSLQSDGKVLIGGNFTSVNGIIRGGIARLNADGTVDTTFAGNQSGANGNVFAVALQVDGKVIIGGDFTDVNGMLRRGIARLNADGTLDASFGQGQTSIPSNSVIVNSIALQPDGRLLLAGQFSYVVNGVQQSGITRLNPDGSPDTSFGNGQGGVNTGLFAVAIQSDGKILIGGGFSVANGAPRGGIARLNVDGSLDTTFGNGLSGAAGVRGIAVEPGGKILIGGVFEYVNGEQHNGIARLNTDGSLDTSFVNIPAFFRDIFTLALASDGKVLIGGAFTNIGGVPRGGVARLNADGTFDTSLGNGQAGVANTSGTSVYAITLQPDGKAVIGGNFSSVNGAPRGSLARLNMDGSLDTPFINGQSGVGNSAYVAAVAFQSDGKILIGGNFTAINGAPRNYFARLNADGTLDASFGSGWSGPDGQVSRITIQSDGKILIAGSFVNFNGVARSRLARINPDGSLDQSFGNALAGESVGQIVVQPDGKIIVGGSFSFVQGVQRRGIARLNPDGSLDSSFSNSQDNLSVNTLSLLSDGKILIGGGAFFFAGGMRSGIARLNSDGSVDTTFVQAVFNTVSAIAVQSDGKIIIGGQFTSVAGVARGKIARLNADGTLDNTFGNGQSGANQDINTVALQPNGKVIVGGTFTSFTEAPRGGIARLNTDGTLDPFFGNGQSGATNESPTGSRAGNVFIVAVQSDWNIVVGGFFNAVNGSRREGIARLVGYVPGVFQFTSSAFTANENSSTRPIAVVRADGNDGAAKVDFFTTDGTANGAFSCGSGADYVINFGSLTWAESEAGVKTFNLTICKDFIFEGKETVNLTLQGAVNATLGSPVNAILTISDESLFNFSTGNYSVSESAGRADITITRTGDLSAQAAITVTTTDGTARQRADYTLAVTTLSFASGEASKTVVIPIVNDAYPENDETVTLTLSKPSVGALLGITASSTLTILNDDSGTPTVNPIDDARFFARQHYFDFLARVPDQGGEDFWTQQTAQCGADANCLNTQRIGVSAQFFIELEFQRTGSYVYRLYRAAYGDTQPFGVAPTLTDGLKLPSYDVFAPDRTRINPRAELIDQSLLDLAKDFVNRSAFTERYPTSQTVPQFVDALLANIQTASGTDLSSERTTLINEYSIGGRGRVLYRLAQDDIANNPVNNRSFVTAEYNRAFVLMQYFGYLRRNPDIGGYNFWLGVLNGQGTSGARFMVCSFITSQEYQERFSSVVTRNNSLCSGNP